MLMAIPARWLEDNGWRVRMNLTHPRPLSGGERAFGWVRRERLDLFLCAFKVLTTSGSAAAPAALSGTLAGENASRWTFNVQRSTFNVQGLPQQKAKTGSPDSESGRPSFVPSVCVCEKQSTDGGQASRRVPCLTSSLTAFARWRSRRAPQQGDLADRSHIKDMNPIPGIDNRRALLLRQKDLFGVFHGNRLAIHSNLERTERARLQSGFQVGEFHRGKSKPGRSEGKPQPVRRIEKTDRLTNGGCGMRRTPFVSFVCFCEKEVDQRRAGVLPASADGARKRQFVRQRRQAGRAVLRALAASSFVCIGVHSWFNCRF